MVKEIEEFGGKYFVSDDGVVLNSDMRVIKPAINHRTGYCQQNLYKNGRVVMRYLHRLVAEHFLSKPDFPCEVNHIDGNKQNNAAKNLEWVTRSENVIHAYRSGLRKTTPVVAFTKDGDFVKAFESVKEAMKFCNVSYNAGISGCLTGAAKTAHGYIWKYATEGDTNEPNNLHRQYPYRRTPIIDTVEIIRRSDGHSHYLSDRR